MKGKAELAKLLLNAANLFRLPALPEVWPDWMTPEKRQSMADNFERYAADLRAMHSTTDNRSRQ